MTSRGLKRPRRILAALIAASAAVQLVLLHLHSVSTAGDGPLYLDGARRLVSGVPLLDIQRSYSGYIALLALLERLHLGLFGLGIVQVALLEFAGLALFAMGESLAGPEAGLWAAGLVLLNPDVFRWNLYVLSDGTYIAGLAIAVWAIWRSGNASLKARIAAFIAALAAGWLVAPAHGL